MSPLCSLPSFLDLPRLPPALPSLPPLAIGGATLSVGVLHKMRERRVFSILLQEREQIPRVNLRHGRKKSRKADACTLHIPNLDRRRS